MNTYYCDALAGLPAKKFVYDDPEKLKSLLESYMSAVESLPELSADMSFGDYYVAFLNVLRVYGVASEVLKDYTYVYDNFIVDSSLAVKSLRECAECMDYRDCCLTAGASSMAIQYALSAGIVTVTNNLFLTCGAVENILDYHYKVYLPMEENSNGCLFISCDILEGLYRYCNKNKLTTDEAIFDLVKEHMQNIA